MKKYILLLLLSFLIGASSQATSNPNYWKLQGSTLTPIRSSWSVTLPSLSVGALTMTGDLDMGNNDINNGGTITTANLSATTATTTTLLGTSATFTNFYGALTGDVTGTSTNSLSLGGVLAQEYLKRDGSVAMTGNFNLNSNNINNVNQLQVLATTTFNGVSYLFPSADGSSNQTLLTNGAGGLSWGSLASTFLELTDTPANYTGAGNKCVAVNGAGNALEFIVCGGGGSSGAGIFATSTDNLLAYVLNGEDSEPYRMLIGGTATTSDVYFELTASSTDGYLSVGNAGNVLRLSGNGRLGLNNASPDYLLDVNGTFRATGNTLLEGNLSVNGTSVLTGDVTNYGTLTANNLTATTTLTSEGTLSILGTSSFTGNITSLGTLTGHTLTATSTLISEGTLAVTGASTFTGNITSLGTLTGNALTATSSLTSEGTLAITGTSAFTGNITSYGTLAGADIVATSSLVIPNGADTTTDSAGKISVNTTSDQFRYYGGAERVLSYLITPSITIASTTWMTMAGATATSTIPIGVAGVAETWISYQCFTDTGTIIVEFGDGTNQMQSSTASTTVGTITTGSNNTFTAGEKRYLKLSNSASTPNFVSCTIKKTYTKD